MGLKLSEDFKSSASPSEVGRIDFNGTTLRKGADGSPEVIANFTSHYQGNNGETVKQDVRMTPFEINNALNRADDAQNPWAQTNRADLERGLDQSLAHLKSSGGDPVAALIANPSAKSPLDDIMDQVRKDARIEAPRQSLTLSLQP